MKIGLKKVRFTIKGPPQKGRATFSILRDEIADDGTRSQSKIKIPELDGINKDLLAERIEQHQALAEVRRLKTQLETREKRLVSKNTFSKYNLSLMDDFIKNDVQKRPNLNNPQAEINKIKQAIHFLGDLSLRTASLDDLQRVADRVVSEGTHKHVIRIYNKMLKYVGRADIKLRVSKNTRKDPPYLSAAQIKKLIQNIPQTDLDNYPHLADLITICFNLGCRIGEALALDKSCLMKSNGRLIVNITKQLRSDMTIKSPKSRSRKVMPLFQDECFAAIKNWVNANLPNDVKNPYRWKISKLVKILSFKLYGIDVEDDGTLESINDLPDSSKNEVRQFKGIHMLRSSHVRHLLALGATLSDVALQLGDHILTVQTYYSGYVHTEETLSRLASLVEKA